MSKKQIESKSLTVSEIAEKTGVSRNLVWSYIRKNKIKPVIKEKKNFRFDFSIVSEIKKKQEKKQQKNNKKDENETVSDAVLEIMHEQLKIKDKQIEKQNETIDFLRSELIRAQLENSKNRKLLEDKQKKEDAMNAENLKTDEKKSFWRKLFK